MDFSSYFPRVELSATGNYREPDTELGAVDVGPLFAALADPTRRRIVELLHDRESTVGGLAIELGVGAPAVSKHLTVLERVGLISRERDAQRRVCRLEPDGFRDLTAWARRYESLWAASLDSLDAYLEQLDRDGSGGEAR